MRSLALTALLGSFIVSSSVVGQTLTEHAAAAAGATVGTAAGKPLGTGLGKVFGTVDNTASKPSAAKAVPAPPATGKVVPEAPAASAAVPSRGVGVDIVGSGGNIGGGRSAPTHHGSPRKALPEQPQSAVAATPPIAPATAQLVLAIPVTREPSAQEMASIKVGATSRELQSTLGAAESTVTIPEDDGHLLEIRQYWANGEPVGTIRLDNGRVVSVRTNN